MEAKNRIKITLAICEVKVKELAEKVSVSPITVSRWCSNAQQPSLEKLYQIAEALDVDVRTLLVSNKQRSDGNTEI